MKNIFKALKFSIFSLFLLTCLVACDKDFSVIESDVLGEGNANFLTSTESIAVTAYNKKLDLLQVNNLASNLLGVFNDIEYGTTTASIVTQLTPTSYGVDFGVNPEINEVIINIPYFSTAIELDADGNNVYQLDSIYGNTSAPTKLTIYRSNYFLRDLDPLFDPLVSTSSEQKYYSNANSTINSALNGSTTINFDDHILEEIFTTDNFKPSSDATVIITDEGTDDEVETQSEPAFREVLDNTFWENTIIAKSGETELSNENNFKNYFRGLYFKAEAVNDDGSMFLVNLESTNASITITYTNGETDARVENTYTLNFTGNKLNTFINDFEDTLEDGDAINGDETLYLKGMEGSMAVVDLFPEKLVECEDQDGNTVMETALDCFLKTYRKTDDTGGFAQDEDGNFILNRLINEAHLEIYEEESELSSDIDHTYDRIYAYDIKNNTTTIDYVFDPIESTDAINSKIFSLGQRDELTEDNEEKVKYKIRLTEHLNNIIQNDSTNYNIGLVISNNVNYTNNSEILNSIDQVTSVPSATIITPRGTILYGSHESVVENKKLKLKIFFTEVKED